jgi:hypothetical protein
MRYLMTILCSLTLVCRGAPPSQFSVLQFGANPSLSDNTTAFQRALDEAAKGGGGRVEVPPGRYRFRGALSIPLQVSLVGAYAYSPSHSFERNRALPTRGSVLEVFGGKGQPQGVPFVTIGENSTLQGFSIYYPEQLPDAPAPTPYPYCVAMRGNNPALLDVELLNPFLGIDASKNQRALVRNVHGQPLSVGLMVDEVFDVGRIENVHWNPWWSINTPIYQWQRANGVGFLFGRTDWHSVLNTFCFGYAVGYRFIQTPKGLCNGSFVGIGADDCHTCIQVDQCAPLGLLITNGQFVAMHGPDPTEVRVTAANTGLLRLVNCSFWGPARRIAAIEGTGTVTFGDCNFQEWDPSQPALDVRGGHVMVRGCLFGAPGVQVRLDSPVQRCIFSENFVTGPVRVESSMSNGGLIERDNLSR